MRKKITSAFILCSMFIALAGCGAQEESSSTGGGVDVAGNGGNAVDVEDGKEKGDEESDGNGDAKSNDDNDGSGGGYAIGVMTDDGFESPYLGLRFTAPDGFVMGDEDDINALMGIASDALDIDKALFDYAALTSTYEMMVSKPSGMPNAMVMTEKLMLKKMTVEQYLEALKEQFSGVGLGYEVSEEFESAEIAGQTYTKLTASLEMLGTSMVQYYYVRKQDDRIVAIIVTSEPGGEADVKTLLSGFAAY